MEKELKWCRVSTTLVNGIPKYKQWIIKRLINGTYVFLCFDHDATGGEHAKTLTEAKRSLGEKGESWGRWNVLKK